MIIENCEYEFITLEKEGIAKDVADCYLCDLSPLGCTSRIFSECLEIALQAIKDDKDVLVFLKKVK